MCRCLCCIMLQSAPCQPCCKCLLAIRRGWQAAARLRRSGSRQRQQLHARLRCACWRRRCRQPLRCSSRDQPCTSSGRHASKRVQAENPVSSRIYACHGSSLVNVHSSVWEAQLHEFARKQSCVSSSLPPCQASPLCSARLVLPHPCRFGAHPSHPTPLHQTTLAGSCWAQLDLSASWASTSWYTSAARCCSQRTAPAALRAPRPGPACMATPTSGVCCAAA